MDHELYMQRCLQLAKQGSLSVHPNPMVGCVIVYQETIIGEGFHSYFGGPHAEVNAIRSVFNPALLEHSTLYVNLEPCAHFGKTPPCADLILKHKIPTVVLSTVDTFSEVAGKGIQKLKDAGVNVITGVLLDEGREINKAFFTFHEKNRPYIILKWAQTLDGYIDAPRLNNEKGIRWITTAETRQLVHQWRSEVAGILVGHNTWQNDEPSLDVREISGPNPTRIIWNLRENGNPVRNLTSADLHITGVVTDVIRVCTENKLQSILIEGGSSTLNRFIEAKLWDEARVLTGTKNFTEGLRAPELGAAKQIQSFILPGGDSLQVYIPE